MKGIVVEINKNDAVILSEEGLFTKVRNENYEVGQAIAVRENKWTASGWIAGASKRTASRWIAGAASMAAVLALCTIGAYAYYTPTDFVSMDVNPSVEYSVNQFDRVLGTKAVNDDGAAILADLDLKNMKLQDAMKKTLDQIIRDGYLTDDPDGGVVIATSNENLDEAKQLAAELEQNIQTYLDGKEGVTAEVDAEAVTPDRVEKAKEMGVTPGKLNLVMKLQESTSGAINEEEWLSKPVREINKTIKQNALPEDGINTDGNGSLKQEKARPGDHESILDDKENGNGNQNKGKSPEQDMNKKQDTQQEKGRDIKENGNHNDEQAENDKVLINKEDRLTEENQNQKNRDGNGSRKNNDD